MTDEPAAKWPDAIITAFLLLPGFITIRVIDYYSTTGKLGDVETVAAALAFTLLIFVCSLLFWRFWESLCRPSYAPIGAVVQRPLFLALIVAVSVGFGFLWAWVDSHDWAYKISPSPRVSRQPIWQWLFDRNAARPEPRFVMVKLKDGTVYFGPPAKYSRSEEVETLYLEPAAKIEGLGTKNPKDVSEAHQANHPVSVRARPCTIVTGGVFLRDEPLDTVEFYLVAGAEKSTKDYCELLRERIGDAERVGAGESKRADSPTPRRHRRDRAKPPRTS